MAVMARESWTDERLDDLKGEMNGRFDQVDKRFDRVEGEIKGTRDELKGEIKGVRGEIKELRDDNKAIQRLMVQGFVTISGAMVAGCAIVAGANAF
jgi:uncharacterized protein YjbJ (UPF0337 family)